uniref:p2X purinoceptor 4 n=1 Tax=Hadrurus spadix TaxID=141984 RepID=A0A1W7RA14_9SCOR
MANTVLSSLLFEYDTVKFITIKSRTVGLLSRFIQLVIIGYLIGYVIVWKKGYQEFSAVESAVTTKVKGVIYTNFSESEFHPGIDKSLYDRIWDVEDLIIPPSENDAFFVTTNVEVTPIQKKGRCAEDPGIPEAACTPENNSCVQGTRLMVGNGVMTGNCIKNERENYSCEIEAWCPVERDVMPLKNGALLTETKNFTVLIKNSVDFPKFKVRRRNIIDSINNETYLQNCRYSQDEDPDCPVFILGDIIHYVNEDEKANGHTPMDYDEIAIKGGVISIIISWDCNLDLDQKYCLPKYSFRRLDDPEAKISDGWNFRYAHYSNDTRALYKAYGIKFVVQVHGQGGKFSPFPLFLNIGSGLALLAVQTYICDLVILYFLKNRKHYRNTKYETVISEEDSIDPGPGFTRFK